MKPEDYDFVASFLKERSGLILTPDKVYLLESRLMPVARKRGLKGIDDLIAKLRHKDDALMREITEAMTTNESFFFRDVKPFDVFRDVVLPYMLRARASRKTLRIWCAAASSGQEPYSLAMLLKEQVARLVGWKIEIVGTDISRDILDKARSGVYTQFEVQRGLPITFLVKYFKKVADTWQIDASIRAMVQFKEVNLLSDMHGIGQFDIVFCRNVLIYFDHPTKASVLGKIAKAMSEDGVLYLGGAETVVGISQQFKPIPAHRGIYAVDGPAGFSLPPVYPAPIQQ